MPVKNRIRVSGDKVLVSGCYDGNQQPLRGTVKGSVNVHTFSGFCYRVEIEGKAGEVIFHEDWLEDYPDERRS